MAFAIFYNSSDLAALKAALSDPALKGVDKTLAGKILNAGLSNYVSAPVTSADHQGGDADTRTLVIDAGGVTLQNLIDLLRKMANAWPEIHWYMRTLADDMTRWSGAQEPWV